MIGVSFRSYNYGLYSYEFPQQQNVLDRGIIRINEYIQELNEDRTLNGPKLGDIVHENRGANRIEHDGLHYNGLLPS